MGRQQRRSTHFPYTSFFGSGYYDDGYDDLADDEGATAASLNDSSTDTGAAEAIEQGGAGGADDEHGNDEFWGDEYYDDDWNTDPADQDDAAHDSPSDADTATDGELTRDGGADDDDAHDRYWEYADDEIGRAAGRERV